MADSRRASERVTRRPDPREVQALFDRHGFVPSPECPPGLLEAHRHLVYFILRAYETDTRVPAGLLTAVVEGYRRYDELADTQPTEQLFDLKQGAGPVRLRLACSPGCNHCCMSPVSVIGPEAVLVGEYIRAKFSPAQKAALDARIEARKQTVGEDRDRNFMCPLNVDGKCTVYVVRPLNCRKFHSFDETACRRKFRDGDDTALIPRANVRGDASGLIWQSVVAAFTALKLDIAELDFMPALEIALRGERIAPRFAAGEPVFSTARREP